MRPGLSVEATIDTGETPPAAAPTQRRALCCCSVGLRQMSPGATAALPTGAAPPSGPAQTSQRFDLINRASLYRSCRRPARRNDEHARKPHDNVRSRRFARRPARRIRRRCLDHDELRCRPDDDRVSARPISAPFSASAVCSEIGIITFFMGEPARTRCHRTCLRFS